MIHMSPRKFLIPDVNIEAKSYVDLIHWEDEKLYEPVFTCNLTQAEVREILVRPLVIPYFPLHTQSTERAVKQVTEAAAAVCGPEKRDGYVRARIAHRELIPKFQSKKDMKVLFQ